MAEVATQELTYREALRDAMADEMRADPRVVVLGEDVGPAGGVFKATAGLYEEFGDDRVMDMPIAESGFVGAALGMAITGMRPVVEIMFADFLGCCADPLINSIAKYRFLAGDQVSVPLVIRATGGGGLGFGGQHSQTAESWFHNIPGLKIVAPATPADAYAMLRAAIREENPVLLLEHKALFGVRGPVDKTAPVPPLSGSAVVRPGGDVTIVASLLMVHRALEAAQILAGQGIQAEVIDLRLLRPLHLAPVIASVQKTKRLLTVEEQPVAGGWGANVVAGVVEEALDFLDAAPRRIGLPDAPLSFSPPLEQAAIPSARAIVQAVLDMV